MKIILAMAMMAAALAARSQDIQVSMELAPVVEFAIEGDSARLSCTAATAMTTESGTKVFSPGIWKMRAPEWARLESADAIEEANQKNRIYVRNNQARKER